MSSEKDLTNPHLEIGYRYYTPDLEVVPQPPTAIALDQAPVSPPLPQERTICGIRPVTFFLSVALAVVIIAAAVGGGVGGSLAVQSAKSACISENTSSNTSEVTVVKTTVTATATATGSAASTTGPLVVPTGVVKLDCPGLAEDIAISLGSDISWVFTPACNIDYTGSDFAAIIAYSFHDCLQACATHNWFGGEDECSAITFAADQTHYIPKDHGNCWLKKGNPTGNKVRSVDVNLMASAKLKGSVRAAGS
ncbi:hypothetical protein NUW58_g2412 [Xylaria curta]|uniref:Uncharacterized protein n=1 Tax=Xylaria curta TaxID=42375 RepID=A0ACC1PH97_9PEZI|nr:hypothetical protein NUW58_g2412 [Xylaria curta]